MTDSTSSHSLLAHATSAHKALTELAGAARDGQASDPFVGFEPMIEDADTGVEHAVAILDLIAGPLSPHPLPHADARPYLLERIDEISQALQRARAVAPVLDDGDAQSLAAVTELCADLDHIEGVLGEILTMLDGR